MLSTECFDEVGSRAVDENTIHDVNILEYKDGVLSQQKYLTASAEVDFSKAVNVYDLKDLDATKLDDGTDGDGNKVKVIQENGHENFIFVVANYGSKIDGEQVPDLAKLKEFKMSFSGKNDMTHLPMTGFYYGGINATSTTQMSVTLQRAVAKISFTLNTSGFKVGGKAPSQLVVDSIKLCNVPGNITLFPCKVRPNLPKDGAAGKWWDNKQTLFPTKDEMEADGGSVTYGEDENHSSTANTYVAYIPENARGSYDGITDNLDKRPSMCSASISEDDEASDKCFTHIRVVLSYVTSDNMLKRATYRIYLGGNDTGDMNVLRNTQYNVTTNLHSANIADTRITVKDLGPAGDVMTENANCYMIDMSDALSVNGKLVTIPLQQVNDGWDYIKSFDANQTSTAATVKSLLESGEWEIQTEWKTWSGSSNVTGTKSAGFSPSNLKATLTIPADVTNGNNAVVKLVSKSNKSTTYWSWHLWFTDYKPDATEGTATNGQVHKYTSSQTKYMMDRNLGATITNFSGSRNTAPSSSDAAKYYGLMYQWGRKDPFVGSDGTGSSLNTKVKIFNSTGGTYAQAIKSGPTTLAISVQDLGSFYKIPGSPYDWLSSRNDDLWSGNTAGAAKSVFDPCPPGWRVPKGGSDTDNPWKGFNTTNFDKLGSGATFGRYEKTTTNAWYPASGYFHDIDGSLNNVGSYGYCWSASPNGQVGYYLCFDSSNVIPSRGDGRARGYPVRCIQE